MNETHSDMFHVSAQCSQSQNTSIISCWALKTRDLRQGPAPGTCARHAPGTCARDLRHKRWLVRKNKKIWYVSYICPMLSKSKYFYYFQLSFKDLHVSELCCGVSYYCACTAVWSHVCLWCTLCSGLLLCVRISMWSHACMHVSDAHCAVCQDFVYAYQCDHMLVSEVYCGVSYYCVYCSLIYSCNLSSLCVVYSSVITWMSVRCAVESVITVRVLQCDHMYVRDVHCAVCHGCVYVSMWSHACMHVSDVHCAVCQYFVCAYQCDHMHVSDVYCGASYYCVYCSVITCM